MSGNIIFLCKVTLLFGGVSSVSATYRACSSSGAVFRSGGTVRHVVTPLLLLCDEMG